MSLKYLRLSGPELREAVLKQFKDSFDKKVSSGNEVAITDFIRRTLVLRKVGISFENLISVLPKEQAPIFEKRWTEALKGIEREREVHAAYRAGHQEAIAA